MKPKILFILHLPPPIHGAAMMGKYIQESELVNSSFDCFCINLATAGSLSDIGHISLKKLLKYFFLLKHISPDSCVVHIIVLVIVGFPFSAD